MVPVPPDRFVPQQVLIGAGFAPLHGAKEASSMSTTNLQIRLTSRPSGEPTLDNFTRTEQKTPEPQAGQMLLRALYLSLDPYMRGRMNAGPSYAAPVEVGDVMEGRTVAQVV